MIIPAVSINGAAADAADPIPIDKSALAISVPRRHRNSEHLRYVAQQPCLVCGRRPCDAHHLKYMQPRALGRKVSDEFTVPLCRIHHRLLHRVGNEAAWWQDAKIDPVIIAHRLWQHGRHTEPHSSDTLGGQVIDQQRDDRHRGTLHGESETIAAKTS